jgi:hypothetical protein
MRVMQQYKTEFSLKGRRQSAKARNEAVMNRKREYNIKPVSIDRLNTILPIER